MPQPFHNHCPSHRESEGERDEDRARERAISGICNHFPSHRSCANQSAPAPQHSSRFPSYCESIPSPLVPSHCDGNCNIALKFSLSLSLSLAVAPLLLIKLQFVISLPYNDEIEQGFVDFGQLGLPPTPAGGYGFLEAQKLRILWNKWVSEKQITLQWQRRTWWAGFAG